jgi:hypothetical protein
VPLDDRSVATTWKHIDYALYACHCCCAASLFFVPHFIGDPLAQHMGKAALGCLALCYNPFLDGSFVQRQVMLHPRLVAAERSRNLCASQQSELFVMYETSRCRDWANASTT